MHRAFYRKSDQRGLWLYGRQPIAPIAPERLLTLPAAGGLRPHRRWHPLRQEWVVYAAHRQDRTFLPAAADNPLAPSEDPARPTELPVGDYDVAVFDNRFPSLVPDAPEPDAVDGAVVKPAVGRCEVVVFAQDPALSLWQLPRDHIALVLEVLADRSRAMAAAGLRLVLPFENRGPEMGVTLHHPHGQIYGYGFVPRAVADTVAVLREYRAANGHDLVTHLARAEQTLGVRLVAGCDLALAFVPAFARFPFETWIVPLRPGADLIDLTDDERDALALMLQQVLHRLDRLWDVRMPYLLTVNQAPCDGDAHPEWTLRIEIWPLRRARDKLKYLAGTELGAGVFASDVLPEVAAAQLRAVNL